MFKVLILRRGLAVSMLPYLLTEQGPLNSSLGKKNRGSMKGRSVTNSFHWKRIQVKQRAPRWAARWCWGTTAFPAGSTPLECIAAVNATVIKVLGVGGGAPHSLQGAFPRNVLQQAINETVWWLPLLCSPQKTAFLLVD